MSKQKHVRSLADHEAQAILSNVRTSPRKLNLVAAMIRNLPAQRAIATLTFSKRRIAHQVRKTLESAIANAENNHQLDVDKLIVARAEVGRSIVMRRFHARGRGRSAQIEKWFSHMKIVVAEQRDEVDDDAIEGTATRTPATRTPPADHALTEATLALPPTVDDEGEAAEQAMSADQAEASDQAGSGDHSAGAGETPVTDHAHTEAGLALPGTVDDEGEAAEQAMSADQAAASDHDRSVEPTAGAGETPMTDHAHTEAGLALPGTVDDEGEAAGQAMSADQAASDQARLSDQAAPDQADPEHHTPPDHTGEGAA
jgi:large subunit ribosomal protein L22